MPALRIPGSSISGALIQISTGNSQALQAIHEFLKIQIKEHKLEIHWKSKEVTESVEKIAIKAYCYSDAPLLTF